MCMVGYWIDYFQYPTGTRSPNCNRIVQLVSSIPNIRLRVYIDCIRKYLNRSLYKVTFRHYLIGVDLPFQRYVADKNLVVSYLNVSNMSKNLCE